MIFGTRFIIAVMVGLLSLFTGYLTLKMFMSAFSTGPMGFLVFIPLTAVGFFVTRALVRSAKGIHNLR